MNKNRFQIELDLRFPIVPIWATITEGMYYSNDEFKAHGRTDHGGIDFAAPIGTPIYAAAAGMAVASYSFDFAKDDGVIRMYQGKTVGYALGHHVRILHGKDPSTGLYMVTSYGHMLERPPKTIAYHDPVMNPDRTWQGLAFPQKPQWYLEHGTPIAAGDLLGRVGLSGKEWGALGYPDRYYNVDDHWDEPHLHFSLRLLNEEGRLISLVDPFDIYGKAPQYQAWEKRLHVRQGLWLPWE